MDNQMPPFCGADARGLWPFFMGFGFTLEVSTQSDPFIGDR
jgi:hypothetical protein